MKQVARFIFNFFWFLFVGLVSGISSLLLGLACCLTVIGIPIGLQHFKFAKLILAPAGKVVATKYSRHPVMNTLWLIFGGLVAYIVCKLLALLLYISIIGIPIASQLSKIAEFNLAPFGSEIVREGEYTSHRDTLYDYAQLAARIAADPDAPCEEGTIRNYAFSLVEQANRVIQEPLYVRVLAAGIPIGFFMLTLLLSRWTSLSYILVLFLGVIPIALAFSFGNDLFFNQRCCRFYSKYMARFFDQFPDSAPRFPKFNTDNPMLLFTLYGVIFTKRAKYRI